MPRLLVQASALLGLVWLAVQLGRDVAMERAVLTAGVVGLAAYVAGLMGLAALHVVRGPALKVEPVLAETPAEPEPPSGEPAL